MSPLYNLAIWLYSKAVRLAAMRNPKARKMVEGQRHTIATLRQTVAPGQKWIWIHAASLGEFEQGRPLIERIRQNHPDLKILLSFFSPSGYEVRHNYPGADAVVYLPFDTPSRVAEFLDTLRPTAAIFVKYEFWGNYLTQLQSRGIPTYIISAIFRKGQIFFRPYGGEFRKMLTAFSHIYVQDQDSLTRLTQIGIHRVTAAGDTRFDRVTDIMKTTSDIPSIQTFRTEAEATFIFGSSWSADEEIYLPWLKAHPQVKAIIAPHEFTPRRLDTLRTLLGPDNTLLYSQIQAGADPAKARYIIIDCFGLLASIYRYADIAYIGGGFGAGIHNLNEAAVYGLPVIFGPNHTKFKEAHGLKTCGGGFAISTPEEFSQTATRLLRDTTARQTAAKAAAHYINSNLGATDRIYNDLFKSPSSPLFLQ